MKAFLSKFCAGLIVLSLAMILPAVAEVQNADPATTAAAEVTQVPLTPVPPRSQPSKPKPVEKPSVPPVAPKSVEPPVPEKTVKPAEIQPLITPTLVESGAGVATGGRSFSCWLLAFAMLMIGIVAGFLGRHLMSRHKLGGMSVRIGTWRGIP